MGMRAKLLMIVTTLSCLCQLGWGGQSEQSEPPGTQNSDPWQPRDLVKPEELAKSLSAPVGEKPLLLYVGYSLPFTGGHIAGSKFIGPSAKPDGIEALTREVQDLPREREIVLYCGCCPWEKCPNIRPAFRTLHEMGFKNLKALYLPNRFSQDWTAKGFPTEKGDAAK